MNRPLAVLTVWAVLTLLLASCAAEPDAPPGPPPSSAASEPGASASSAPEPDAAAAELLRVGDACRRALGDPAADGPVRAPDELLPRLVDIAAGMGVAVRAEGGALRNHEQAVSFCADVEAGRDAQLRVYTVSPFGVDAYELVQRGGRRTTRALGYTFTGDPQDSHVEPETPEAVEVERIELNDSGYMIWGERDAGGGVVYAVRVTPQTDELLELGERYVRPLLYPRGELLSADWDARAAEGFDFAAAFESLYVHENGESYEGSFARDGAGVSEVPAEAAEELLCRYLPVDPAQVREDPGYDAAAGVYRWSSFAGEIFLLAPDVTSQRRNDDGSLTLTVRLAHPDPFPTGVADDGSNRVREITVLPEEDGFQYVSCRVIGGDKRP